jgi:methylated-DNA-[protein]-cysteine S-methyltransferase
MNRICLSTPVGPIALEANDRAVVRVSFGEEPPVGARTPILARAERELEEYFAGTRTDFTFPLELTEGTAFQQRVWRALGRIPFGETRSYGDVARQVGSPRAVRAVGAANKRNPIAIVLPCHRVIGADGSLTGFGGGLPVKKWLLEHEARQRADARPTPKGHTTGRAERGASRARG